MDQTKVSESLERVLYFVWNQQTITMENMIR
jgi:hypothetical protein